MIAEATMQEEQIKKSPQSWSELLMRIQEDCQFQEWLDEEENEF